MIWINSALIALSVFRGTPLASAPPSGPAQIILLRHAEKPADTTNPHLSPAGIQRAQRLVAFITTDPVMTRFGPPVAIFATATTKDDDGQRTQETVAPLARATKLQVQAPFHGKDYAALAKQVLSNPAYAGKTVVICWNHEVIPELAAALGVRPAPPRWRGSVFDLVYVIDYHKGGAKLTSTRYQ